MSGRKRRAVSFEKKKRAFGLLFVLPWLIGVVFLNLKPLVASVIYSFSESAVTAEGLSLAPAGFGNYKALFTSDPDFLRMLTGSVSSVLYQIPIVIIVSLFAAILLNKPFRGRLFFRVVFFLPVVIASGYVISVLNGVAARELVGEEAGESALLMTESMGAVFQQLGVSAAVRQALLDYAGDTLNLLWKCGVQILLFLAGLQSVSPSLREAASVEGVDAWQYFWKITLPVISPVILLNIVYTVVDSFTDASNALMSKIYALMSSIEISAASAMAWLYFVTIAAVIGLFYVIAGRRVFYAN